MLSQVFSNLEDQGFQVSGGAAGVVRGLGPVGPIDPIEALPVGTMHPAEYRGRADMELPSNLVERTSAANGGYHVVTALAGAVV